MRIKVLTLFPELFDALRGYSILGRAQQSGAISLEAIDIRAFSERKHKNADDYPFGGGAGMVMLAQPIVHAVRHATQPPFCGPRILLSPRGRALTQSRAEQLAREQDLLLLCGHYEGIDERAIELCVDEELSIGDYVLTGGELAAMVVIDAVARLVPGVLGCEESPLDESFSSGLLEYPQYTRPREFEGLTVPDVLLSGDHARIARWRREQALRITRARRPEMLARADLTPKERAWLEATELTE